MSCQAVTNGYKCSKGTVTIGAVDPSIVTHGWMVDGVPETAAQFQRTYTEAGIHNILHAGTNSCGGVCSQSSQLEIVDVIPPPPQQSTPSGGAPIVLMVAVVAVLGLGIVMLKKKK